MELLDGEESFSAAVEDSECSSESDASEPWGVVSKQNEGLAVCLTFYDDWTQSWSLPF